MKLKITFVILLCYFVSSCGNKSENKEDLEIIDIAKAFEQRKSICIGDISKDYIYVVLETTDESLIGANYTIYSNDEYLIAIDSKQMLIFDRESGRFIRKIGSQGNGPNEYSRPYTKMPFDEEKGIIYADRSRERYAYDINGHLSNTMKGPELVYDFVNVDDLTYAAFIDNYMGDEKNKMLIFNENDSIFKKFPNYQSFPFKGMINVYSINSWFYKLNEQLYFCERFNDTLFSVTPDSLIPRFVFNKGAYAFPYELRGDKIDPGNQYFLTENILESPGYLFFTFTYSQKVYTALYDKGQKRTFLTEYIGESGKGYIDNINDFVPLELSSINGKGELTCTIDAFKVKQWFEKNAEKTDKLPENIQKLKNISETENPIVIVAKLIE